jgi:recombinational DNA repair ATPase RecF
VGFWAWFWVWAALAFGSSAFFAFLFWNLWTKAEPVLHQIQLLADRVEPLSAAAQMASDYKAPDSELLNVGEDVFAQRAELVRNKEKRVKARERRLIASLNAIDVNERRFTDAS